MSESIKFKVGDKLGLTGSLETWLVCEVDTHRTNPDRVTAILLRRESDRCYKWHSPYERDGVVGGFYLIPEPQDVYQAAAAHAVSFDWSADNPALVFQDFRYECCRLHAIPDASAEDYIDVAEAQMHRAFMAAFSVAAALDTLRSTPGYHVETSTSMHGRTLIIYVEEPTPDDDDDCEFHDCELERAESGAGQEMMNDLHAELSFND